MERPFHANLGISSIWQQTHVFLYTQMHFGNLHVVFEILYMYYSIGWIGHADYMHKMDRIREVCQVCINLR